MNIFKRFIYNFQLGFDDIVFSFLVREFKSIFFNSLISDLDRNFWNYPKDYFLIEKLKEFGFKYKIIKIEYPFTFFSKNEDNLYLMISSYDHGTEISVVKEEIPLEELLEEISDDYWKTLFTYTIGGHTITKNSEAIEAIDMASEKLKAFLEEYNSQENY